MTNLFATLGHAVLDLVFPPLCEVCGRLQEPPLCAQCVQQFELIREPYCAQCGLPFDPLAQSPSHCAQCNNDPPPFDAARAVGVYGGALRRSIHILKYNLVRSLSVPLGDLMAQAIQLPFDIDCLCPVPLHPARENMRGFNQSQLLAERLASAWQLPVRAELLARTQNTVPQMSLPHDQRISNVRGAFSASSDAQHLTVGLVDDVFTTGSTLRECTRVLKRAGATRVLVLTLARTL